jgi:hypothetical protein
VASKLSPHCLRPTADARLLVEAGCRLVKLVDDFGAAAEYLAINPNLIILGRGYTETTLLQQLESGATPEKAAEAFVREQKEKYYDRNPLIKIWEGHNEPSFGGPNESGALARMNWYARFEAERLRLLADLGLRGVIGNFSTGYPEVGQRDIRMWEAFLAATTAARNHNGFLGLHEYSAPWVWWLTGNYQEGNCPLRRLQPGWREENLGDLGWLTLRYRQVYRYALKPHDLADIPLVITELGCDAVGHNCPGTPSGAWKDLASFWDGYDGSRDPIDYWRNPSTPQPSVARSGERDAERYYAEQLIWYDRELQKDAYVLGATIFTFGASTSTWDKYNVAGSRVPKYLAAHIRQTIGEPTLPLPPITRPAPPMPPPPPAETPVPPPPPTQQPNPPTTPSPRGQPREQYSRIYVLLPPTATDPAWVEAIADATWTERRFTIGASADDAGIGNLHARMVVAVNPQGWGVEPPIDQWFAKNYPGVTYISIRAQTPAELKAVLKSTPLPPPVIARAGPPQVPTGLPREQYERTYVLFNPKQSDPTWIRAMARATWARRLTMGGSADDAGIGDLNFRRVIAINSREWDGNLATWFERNYSGISLEVVEARTPDEAAQRVKGLLGV